MTQLHIIDRSGDTQVVIEEDTDLAAELFQKAINQGGMAYRVGLDPKDKVVIHDLSEVKEDTAKVVVRGPLAGG